jgi:hypothetical protein
METTEKIVESYCRYVKGWLTLPNIKCKGQYEIDLLAVDTQSPKKFKRYHIESGVSISGSYSKLTNKDFSPEDLKIRVKQAGQRRSLGYFIHRKFDLPEVKAELRKYGFVDGNYSKIVVTWGWRDDAKEVADREGIQLWDFRDLVKQIADACRDHKTYFTDDTARTIQLFAKAVASASN